MIRPQLSADGLAVRLPLGEHAAPLVDDLALAYVEDSEAVGALLADHAANVVALEHAAASVFAPDHVRAMRAAEADGTREALLAESENADRLDALLDPAEAIRLADDLTAYAARILTTDRNAHA